MYLKTKLISIFAILSTGFALADSLSVNFENDLFYHSDNDYSHGSRIQYETDYGARFGVQQQMYTPNNLKLTDQVEGNHPYAGTLLGFVGYRDVTHENHWLTTYDDIELLVGVMGPSSHADDVQKGIHKVIGAKNPQGWDHQLKDEFEIELSYWNGADSLVLGDEYGWSLRWITEVGGLVGTLQIAVGVNSELKLGYGFGAAEEDNEMRIRAVEKPACSIYGILGVEGRYWLRNELLEGNAGYVHNHDTLTVDKEDLTGCVKAGVGVRCKNFFAEQLWLWWSKEYETQEDVPHYTSLIIGWYF